MAGSSIGQNGGGRYPEWATDEHPEYHARLERASMALLEELRAAPSSERRRFALDPREAHKRLYLAVTPDGYPEYAGTYRGTKDTPLELRHVELVSHTGRTPEQVQIPSLVLQDMENSYGRRVNEYFDNVARLTIPQVRQNAATIFYLFGRIHPFLDGNGHIQRLVFAACMFERCDLVLNPKWTVHPRPYGYEFADAVEGHALGEALRRLQPLLNDYVEVAK